jgi:hypothetical protein
LSDEIEKLEGKDTTVVDSIVVNWPSGRTSEIFDVEVDQVLVVQEHIPESSNLVAFSGLIFTAIVLFIWRHHRG